MRLDLDSTIVAAGSGLRPSLRGVVRISGKRSGELLAKLVGAESAPSFVRPGSLEANVCFTLAGRQHSLHATCYFWPNDRSFTGEPSLEVHLPGSVPILEAVIEQCIRYGARHAERGEFTLRSFLAGKIDLAQAEAVLGVIEAESADDLQNALGQLAGNISAPVKELKDALVELVSHLEAGLDFVEEDIEFISQTELQEKIGGIAKKLGRIKEQIDARSERKRLPRVTLVGLPNAGKSTLFNALIEQDRSIVSDVPGTTRDSILATLSFDDSHVELVDTAGAESIRDSSPRGVAQEVLGQSIRESDLILFCVACGPNVSSEWFFAQRKRLAEICPVMVVNTKSDLLALQGDWTLQWMHEFRRWIRVALQN